MIRRPPRSTLFPYTRSSDLALATGLRRVMQDRALTTASPANPQKMISVPSTAYSPFGSEGSHSVETGCVCADRKSTRLNSSHSQISYAVFCLKKKKKNKTVIESKKKNQKKENMTSTNIYILNSVMSSHVGLPSDTRIRTHVEPEIDGIYTCAC